MENICKPLATCETAEKDCGEAPLVLTRLRIHIRREMGFLQGTALSFPILGWE